MRLMTDIEALKHAGKANAAIMGKGGHMGCKA